MCLLNNGYNCQLLCHVQGFPLLRLLRADLTSKGSSFALLLARLPYHFLMEHLWISQRALSSQIVDASLHTCHDLITPLTRHNLTITIALLGLRWRYKPRQSDLIFIGAIPALQGHASPMAYMILCVRFTYIVHLVANVSLISISPIPNSAISATLDTGGWLNLT